MMSYFIARNNSESIQIGDDYMCYREVARGSVTVKDRSESSNGTNRSYVEYSGSSNPILVIRSSEVFCCLAAQVVSGTHTRWYLMSDSTGNVNYSIVDRLGISKAVIGMNIRNSSGALVYSSDMRQVRHYAEIDRYANGSIPSSGEYGFVVSSTGFGFAQAVIEISGTMIFCAGHKIGGGSISSTMVAMSFAPIATNEFSGLNDFYTVHDGSYAKIQILRLS